MGWKHPRRYGSNGLGNGPWYALRNPLWCLWVIGCSYPVMWFWVQVVDICRYGG